MSFDGADLYQWAAAAEAAGDAEQARMVRAEAATRPYRNTRRETAMTFASRRHAQAERRRGERRCILQPPYFGERRTGADGRAWRPFDHRTVNR